MPTRLQSRRQMHELPGKILMNKKSTHEASTQDGVFYQPAKVLTLPKKVVKGFNRDFPAFWN